MSLAFLDHLADYLEAQGLGTVGATIFEDDIPPDVQGLLLIETGGRRSDPLLPSYYTRIQITARFTDPESARVKCWAIYQLLDNRVKLRVGGVTTFTKVIQCKALQPPFSLGVDERLMNRIAINLEFLLSGR